MASTYTTTLRMEKTGDSEQAGTWGTTLRSNYDMLDRTLTGVYDITVTNGATTATLTASGSPGPSDPAIYGVIRIINASKSTDYTLTVPVQDKAYHIINLTPKVLTVTTGVGLTTTIAANSAATCLSVAATAAAGVFILGPDAVATLAAATVAAEASSRYIVAVNASATASYSSTDHRKYQRMSNAGAITVTMLAPVTPYGDVVTLEKATGAGDVTINGDAGVTVSVATGATNVISVVGKSASLISINATTWKMIS